MVQRYRWWWQPALAAVAFASILPLLPSASAGAAAAPSLRIVFANPAYTTLAVDTGGAAYGIPADKANEIWRSTDEGRTWTQRSSFPSNYRLYYMTPLRSGAILAAVDIGSFAIFRSGDGGSTFAKVLTLPTSPCFYSTLTPHNITEGNGFVFLGTYNNCPEGQNTNYVYRSSDDGRTWTTIYTSTTHRHDHGLQFDPGSNALYALYGDSKGGIERSTDNGVSWQSICTSYDDCVGIDIAFGAGFGIYGTDTQFKQNYIERMDIATFRTTRVAQIPWVSYSAYALSSTQFLVGTARETGQPPGDPNVHLYASVDGGRTFTDVYSSAIGANGPTRLQVQFSYPNGDFPIQLGPGTIVAHLVTPVAAPVNTAVPVISGAAVQGQTLTTSNGDWTGNPTALRMQWRRCDLTGEACDDIAGASGRTYTLQSADVGRTVRVVVTGDNDGGSAPAASRPTALVVAAPPPAPAPPPPPLAPAPPPAFGISGGGGLGPDLHVQLDASASSAPAVGSELRYSIKVSARAGAASAVVVDVTLPDGFKVAKTYADRGPGCTGTGARLTCDVAWISPGTDSNVMIWGTVGLAGDLVATASARSLLEPERDPSDNSATLKLPSALPTAAAAAGTSARPGSRPKVTHGVVVTGVPVVGGVLRATLPVWPAPVRRLALHWQVCNAVRCRTIAGASGQMLKLLPGFAGHSVRLMVTARVDGAAAATSSREIAVHKKR